MINVDRIRIVRILSAILCIASFASAGIGQSSNPSSRQDSKPANSGVPPLGSLPARGNPKARIAIIEFGDYQCPYCARHAKDVLPQILTKYVDTGKIRYLFKDTPVEALHPQAIGASQAALCARDQNKYWEMHDRLFQFPQALAQNELSGHARALALNVEKFKQCLESRKYEKQLREAMKEAADVGVRGTPTFFIVALDSKGIGTSRLSTLSGGIPFTAFQQTLDRILAEQDKLR